MRVSKKKKHYRRCHVISKKRMLILGQSYAKSLTYTKNALMAHLALGNQLTHLVKKTAKR
jgi:hypothetical protein